MTQMALINHDRITFHHTLSHTKRSCAMNCSLSFCRNVFCHWTDETKLNFGMRRVRRFTSQILLIILIDFMSLGNSLNVKIEHSDKKNSTTHTVCRLIGRCMSIARCFSSSKFHSKNKNTNQIKQIHNFKQTKHEVTLIRAVVKCLPIVDYMKAMREPVYYADESQSNVFVMRASHEIWYTFIWHLFIVDKNKALIQMNRQRFLAHSIEIHSTESMSSTWGGRFSISSCTHIDWVCFNALCFVWL